MPPKTPNLKPQAMKINSRIIGTLAVLTALWCSTAHAKIPIKMALGAAYYNAMEYQQHGGGVKLQVNVIKNFRLEPEIIYFAQHKDVSTLNLNLNLQYVRTLIKGINLYPFAGASYSHWGYDGEPNASRWGLNLGCGAELDVIKPISIFAETRLQFVSHESQPIFAVGVKYRL